MVIFIFLCLGSGEVRVRPSEDLMKYTGTSEVTVSFPIFISLFGVHITPAMSPSLNSMACKSAELLNIFQKGCWWRLSAASKEGTFAT